MEKHRRDPCTGPHESIKITVGAECFVRVHHSCFARLAFLENAQDKTTTRRMPRIAP